MNTGLLNSNTGDAWTNEAIKEIFEGLEADFNAQAATVKVSEKLSQTIEHIGTVVGLKGLADDIALILEARLWNTQVSYSRTCEVSNITAMSKAVELLMVEKLESLKERGNASSLKKAASLQAVIDGNIFGSLLGSVLYITSKATEKVADVANKNKVTKALYNGIVTVISTLRKALVAAAKVVGTVVTYVVTGAIDIICIIADALKAVGEAVVEFVKGGKQALK